MCFLPGHSIAETAEALNLQSRDCERLSVETHGGMLHRRHDCVFLAESISFTAIQTHSPNKPALIFVSSRRQTRLTALDLIAYLAAEHDPKQWLHMDEAEVLYFV